MGIILAELWQGTVMEGNLRQCIGLIQQITSLFFRALFQSFHLFKTIFRLRDVP